MDADTPRVTLYDRLARHPGRLAAVLILVTALLRLWFVATQQLGLVQDEAQYWDWTRRLQLTYYSKGPLIAWIIRCFTLVFGDTELGVRMGSLVGGTVFPALMWWFVARMWKRPVLALLAVFLIVISPLFEALGVLMTTDDPFVVCWMLVMIALYAATAPTESGRSRGLWPYVLLALAYGVGILAKYTMLGFAGLAVLHGLILRRRGMLPRRFWPRLCIALAAGIVIGFLPTFYWNMQHGFVGYKHVFFLIGVAGKKAHHLIRLKWLPEYLGAQLGFALPWWFCLMLIGGWRAAVLLWRPASPAAAHLRLDAVQASLLAVCFWPMNLFFFAWACHTKVLANWNTVSFVAGCLLGAAEIERLLRSPTRRRLGWLKAGAWASAGLTVFIFIHQMLPIPPSLNPANRLKGWQDMGIHVSEVAAKSFDDPAHVFYMSDVYDITSELAFYVPGQPRAYCLWWGGRRMNQYDLWGGPENKTGWDAVLVLRGDSPSLPPVMTDMFARITGPYFYVATYRGHPVRPFYYYLCRHYTGRWPAHTFGRF